MSPHDEKPRRLWSAIAPIAMIALVVSAPARAWGPEGHAVVALIAQHYLNPQVRQRVDRMLAADTGRLTAHDIASEADWADAWRDAGGDLQPDGRHHRTSQWHFVNLELHRPNLRYACWGRKPLPADLPASQGSWRSCVVDKIDQFEAELESPVTSAHERLLALKFLLHLVGDLHQPLHAADNHDHGGNDVRVSGLSRRPQRLHHAWDGTFVHDLGRSAQAVAVRLEARISAADIRRWQRGTPTDWAWQSYRMAKDDVYGKLPHRGAGGVYRLDRAYRRIADADVSLQLSRAGVRLAWLLDRALGASH